MWTAQNIILTIMLYCYIKVFLKINTRKILLVNNDARRGN